MLISQNNNVNFTGTPIRNLNVKSTKAEAIKVMFSKLKRSSAEDREAVRQIKDQWPAINRLESFNENRIYSEVLTDFFCKNFLSQSDSSMHYAIEFPKTPGSKGSFGEKIMGLIALFTECQSKRLNLMVLSTNPKFLACNKSREIKGIGEVLLGETFRLAKKNENSAVCFNSVNDDFYTKTFNNAGIKIDKDIYKKEAIGGNFTIPSKYFDTCLNYIDHKYGNNPR